MYDIDRTIKRNVDFITDDNKKGALIRIGFTSGVVCPPVDSLDNIRIPADIYKYCSQILENMKCCLSGHIIDDDWIPYVRPFLGIAEHTCFIGGNVSYGGNTSYHHQAVDDIKDWKSLRCDINQPHYKALLDGMAYLSEKVKGTGIFASLRGGEGPADIANAVRGNDLLYDFYDEPDETAGLMGFCADAASWTFENQRPFATEICGGIISGMGTWMPKNSVGHISEDATCIMSPELYEEFGLPYTRKFLGRYDYALMHIHSLGRKYIPQIASMEKIKMFEISSDPKEPAAIEVYREYDEYFAGRAVYLNLSPDEVFENLDFFRGRRTVINTYAKDIYEAERLIDAVRNL